MSEDPIGSQPSLNHPNNPDEARLDVGASLFRMLAEPTRLHILWLLSAEPGDVSSLVKRTGATRTSVSQHLAKLRFSGLVTARRSGRNVIYSIADGHLARLVREGLNHADHRVTGEPSHD